MAHFAETKFQTEQILMEAVRLIVNSLLTDKELRVKVQAAISLQMLLTHQDKVQEYLRPQVLYSINLDEISFFYDQLI